MVLLMAELWILILTLFVTGLAAGVLAGLFGVGGGLILVPAFVWAFEFMGYDHAQLMQIAVATSLATIILTSIRSVLSHHKRGAVDWDVLIAWALPLALGAGVAVLVARDLKSQVMMVIFALFALVIAYVLFFQVGRRQIADDMPRGFKKWMMGVVTGFFSTMMGIGGGSIAVPIMVAHGRAMHQAVGTAAGFGALIAVPSVFAFAISRPVLENLPPFQIGYVNLMAFLIVVVATMIAAPIGARWAHSLDAGRLKRYFAVFILIVAINMLRKAIFM